MTATAAQLALVEERLASLRQMLLCANDEEEADELEEDIAALAAVLADAKALPTAQAEALSMRNAAVARDEQCDALRAENETLRKDAERYRWLRGDVPAHSVRWSRWRIEHWASPPAWSDIRGEVLDTAIDAALAREPKPEHLSSMIPDHWIKEHNERTP